MESAFSLQEGQKNAPERRGSQQGCRERERQGQHIISRLC